jgi:hypothetical protein
MSIPSHLLETGHSDDQGLHKVAELSGCHVYILNHCVENSVRAFAKVERRKNNRVMMLADGDANLVLCDNGDKPGEAYVTRLDKNVVYNVPKSVWHHIVLRKNAQVIIIDKNEKGEVKETELLENYVIRSCWREFNFNKIRKVRRKKAGKTKKMSKELKKHLDSIQQLSIWPEFQ